MLRLKSCLASQGVPAPFRGPWARWSCNFPPLSEAAGGVPAGKQELLLPFCETAVPIEFPFV